MANFALFMEMVRIAVVGLGRVGKHLIRAFSPYAHVTGVQSRSLSGLPHDADIYFITVPDSVIGAVSMKVRNEIDSGLLVHVSAATSIDVLPAGNGGRGVFYPLQTFSDETDMDYRSVPVFVEGDSPKTVEFLRYVGKLFSDNVREADLEYRLRLHVAAVLACNCVNRLFVHADRILNDLDTDIRIMWPLINETVKKLQTMTPLEAQTGPAARGDRNTVDLHLAILEAKPQTQQIYRIISNDIQDECSRL